MPISLVRVVTLKNLILRSSCSCSGVEMSELFTIFLHFNIVFVLSLVTLSQGSNVSEPEPVDYIYDYRDLVAHQTLTKLIANVTGLRLARTDSAGVARKMSSEEIVETFVEMSSGLENSAVGEDMMDNMFDDDSKVNDLSKYAPRVETNKTNAKEEQINASAVNNIKDEAGQLDETAHVTRISIDKVWFYVNRLVKESNEIRNETPPPPPGIKVEEVNDKAFSSLNSVDMFRIRRFFESLKYIDANANKSSANNITSNDLGLRLFSLSVLIICFYL